MKLDLKELKNLLDNVQKHRVQQIRITDNNFELLINASQRRYIDSLEKHEPLNKDQYTKLANIKEETTYINLNKDLTTKSLTIVSPMVGTFYRASSPNEPPFVNILDQVQSNQIVCIIEAMKLMNEIEAEVNGRIIDILVEDGEFVDCGQALMIVEPIVCNKT